MKVNLDKHLQRVHDVHDSPERIESSESELSSSSSSDSDDDVLNQKIKKLKCRIFAPGAPKPPLKAYMRFTNERRKELKRDPTWLQLSKIHREKFIYDKWHQLSKECKVPYIEAAAKGRAIYKKKLRRFLRQNPNILEEELAKLKKKQTKRKAVSSSSSTDDDDPHDLVPLSKIHLRSTSDPATYATPTINQTVKILRRPAQAEERRDTNGMKPKQPIKTLKQREQEYAEARLRILGAAKNPEDDKPPTPPTPPGGSLLATPQTAPPAGTHSTLPAVSYNNNNNNNNSNPGPGPGMHRSSSAPKMSQVSAMYNNYNSYFQGPHNPGLNYYYQHAGPQPPQQQPPVIQPHFNQRMPPYGVGGGMGMGGMPAQSPPQSSLNQQQQQQSWSPVVGGSVSAALLRQQSMQQSPQQHQQQHQPPQTYNDNVLRLPRGPCPNGSVGFQMRR
ncbi:uncharacterized protein LOC121403962 [Drosophila obscura]|uniref:uncharacterized protein LOC121403962 n=1 Tax=Drosophila obscura TaxID=7282 RepID=UPI001BB0FF0C|nr:uncharacterized protein LOC121403962 [Drosophila obscura]